MRLTLRDSVRKKDHRGWKQELEREKGIYRRGWKKGIPNTERKGEREIWMLLISKRIIN